MALVSVHPAPSSLAKGSRRFWQQHPPLFDLTDGPITNADRELAIELIEAADDLTQEWYAPDLARLRADLAAK